MSTAIREGGLPYPIIGGIHLLAIAWFGGMLLATDLRLLGLAMRRRAVSDVVLQFQPWKRVGFVILVSSGLLLAWSEPVRLWGSPSFWVKMTLFALVGVHAMVFRAGVYRDPSKLDASISRQARIAAVLSLVLWAGLIVSGRLIAFDDSFEPKPISRASHTERRMLGRIASPSLALWPSREGTSRAGLRGCRELSPNRRRWRGPAEWSTTAFAEKLKAPAWRPRVLNRFGEDHS